MPSHSFYTLNANTEGIYKEKGSRFHSFAFPLNSEADIKEKIGMLKKKYFDARHHCYAWILGPDKDKFRAFDDGEPNHSAGDPILGQIRSKNLTNVLVVVVRYFGGVKLGVGGLMGAYKAAAEDALGKGLVIEEQVVEKINLSYDYSITTEVMRMVRDFDLTIVQQDFSEGCSLTAELQLRHKEKFDDKVKLMTSMGMPITYVK